MTTNSSTPVHVHGEVLIERGHLGQTRQTMPFQQGRFQAERNEAVGIFFESKDAMRIFTEGRGLNIRKLPLDTSNECSKTYQQVRIQLPTTQRKRAYCKLSNTTASRATAAAS
jgi:hypothetical protein